MTKQNKMTFIRPLKFSPQPKNTIAGSNGLLSWFFEAPTSHSLPELLDSSCSSVLMASPQGRHSELFHLIPGMSAQVHPGALVLIYLRSCHQLPSPTHLNVVGRELGVGETQHSSRYLNFSNNLERSAWAYAETSARAHMRKGQEQDVAIYPFSRVSALEANLQRKVLFLPCKVI